MIYNKYKQFLLSDLLSLTVKAAILGPNYIYQETHEFFSEVSASEVIAGGYVAGGQELANKTLVQQGKLFPFKADNPTWAIIGQVALKHVVFYIDSGNPNTSRLLSFYTFPNLRTVINGNLIIEIPEQGILSMQ